MKKLLIILGSLVMLLCSFFITYTMQAPIKVSETQSSINHPIEEEHIIQPDTAVSAVTQTFTDTTTYYCGTSPNYFKA